MTPELCWAVLVKRFIEGEARSQSTLFADRRDDCMAGDNRVRVFALFIDELSLG